MTSRLIAVTLLATVLSWANYAVAQKIPARSSRVEIWGGWVAGFPASGGTLQVDYEPVLLLGGTRLESRTTQALDIDQEAGSGFDLGMNVFFGRVFGVQAAFTRSSAAVTGLEGEYSDRLRYVSTPPPGSTPVENTYERTAPARAAGGSLTCQSVSLGGVARWEAGAGRVGGTVSGGVNFDRHSGEVENAVYTQFILGGHSTLFAAHHHLVMEPEGSDVLWRPYGAADFHVKVATQLAIMAGIRVSFGSPINVPVAARALVDPGEDTWTPTIDDVRRTLGVQPLELPGTRWRFILGAKVFLG